MQKIVAGADAGSARQSSGSVRGGLQAQFFRGVGVQQIRLQHAALNHDRAARGNALAIEWGGAEAAAHGAVVDDGDLVSRDFLAQLAGQKRRAAVNRVSVNSLENMTEDGVRDHGIEHHRHMCGFDLASAKTAQCALRGYLSYVLGDSKRPRLRATENQ